jgi:hypothetical protein
MRKGLVTLGVVALVLAVSPSFAEAPILSCLPDVVISDAEENSQTADYNLFIFSKALNLDEYVQDGDTPVDTLRWAGFDSNDLITINGIRLNDPNAITVLEPGASDLRAVAQEATFVNHVWYGDTGATSPSAGAVSETFIEINVSDGTTSGQGTMKVTTVNATMDVGDPDAVLPVEQQSFDFAADEQGWKWFDITTTDISPAGHGHAAGALTMTEPTAHTTIIFGGWESPQDPADAVTPKMGCIMRARFQIASDQAVAADNPGMRFRALTFHVVDAGGGNWGVDFLNKDTTSNDWVQYGTIGFIMGSGDYDSRVPGTGSEYTLLTYPLQVADTLLSEEPGSPVIVYFAGDMLDLEGAIETDSGTYSIDSVVIDGIDRPDMGAGTTIAGMSTADFSTGWIRGAKPIPPATTVRSDMANLGTDMTITVNVGEERFEAFTEQETGVPLVPGQYVRVAFTVTSTEAPTGDQGPTCSVGVTSSAFLYTAQQTLTGGGLFSHLSSTPTVMEVWLVAPTEKASTPGQTEEMKALFKSFLETNSVPQFPSGRFVSGTITCSEVQTEAFELTGMGLVPAP